MGELVGDDFTPQNMDDTSMQDIASLVGSRICHDLISPIGAIGNGVELLSLTDGDTTSEMALISESVENANARIRFFRIAYGATVQDQMVSRNEVMSILGAVARGGRCNYMWQIETDQQRALVRAAFLAMQCFETAMPLGGDITVSNKNHAWTLNASSDRLNIDPDLWQSLTEETSNFEHSAAQVQFALLPTVLRQAGRPLHLTTIPSSITISF